MLSRAISFLEREFALVLVATIAAIVLATRTVTLSAVPGLVDWRLLQVLFALLIAVDLLRSANVLDHLVSRKLARFTHARSFSLALIGVAGILSALFTNDVALFIIIPFTIAATRLSSFKAERVVMLEVIAANLVGCISPLGNPQNLFVYHQSHWRPAQFLVTMLPFCFAALVLLVLATFLLERREVIRATAVERRPIDRVTAAWGVACFLLVVAEVLRVLPAWPAAAVAALSLLTFLRHRVEAVGLTIVPLFFFAFIAVAGLERSGVFQAFGMTESMSDGRLFLTAITASQIISNVPATIALEPFAADRWKLLLYAVNAAGCGTLIASLANLLGWQIYRRERPDDASFLRNFVVLNFVFLALMAPIAWWLARL